MIRSKYFDEIAPKTPLRLPRTNNKDKILFVCHGRRYRIQNKSNIYTLDSHKEALPDFKISIKSKNFKIVMKDYRNYFDKIYILCCPYNSFLVKRKHYIPDKKVFNNLAFILKLDGLLYMNNYQLVMNKNTKQFSGPDYFTSYLNDFDFVKLTTLNNSYKQLVLRKI